MKADCDNMETPDSFMITLAEIASLLLIQDKVVCIYDFQQSKWFYCEAEKSESKINIFDYETNSTITGSTTSLYDVNTQSYISFKDEGGFLSVYSYLYNKWFTIKKDTKCQDGLVLYDCANDQLYHFAVYNFKEKTNSYDSRV